MNFFKKLFGGAQETPQEEKAHQEAKDFDVLKYDGVAALRQHQVEYAIKCFRHALDMKDDLETRDYLSQALIQNNELLAAYEQLQKLAEAQPDNLGIWMRMSEVAYMIEDYGAMADCCEKAKLLDKDDPRVNYNYARACLGQGDQINAIAMLTKAIAVNQKAVEEEKKEGVGYFYDAYLLRGQTLLKMGDVTNAEQDADFLMQHVEGNEDILMLKARCQEAGGHHDEAIQTFTKVIEANPFCADAFRERGAIRLAQGDKDGAEEDARSVLEINPELADGHHEAEGTEDIAAKVQQAYKNVNPFA